MGGGHRQSVVDARLPSGAELRVRVVEEAGGFEEVGRLAPADLEEAFGAIEETAGLLHRKLATIAPRRASVEFGVSLSMKSGKLAALVFEGQGQASMTVTLEWEHN